MTCNELRDHYELYAIGVAEDPERGEIRTHLNRGCEVCMQGIKQAREIVTLLGGAAAPSEPSPKLRRRILASVGLEERRFGWAPFLAAALALSLFAVFYFVGREGETAKELARAREELGSRNIELARLNEAFTILNGADTTVTSFGKDQAQPPSGNIFVNRSQGVLLIANRLPPAPAGKAYEMWIIPKGGKPKPAGMFQSASDGSGMHVQRGPVDTNADVVAVTMEPAAGSDQPTSTPLFAAPIRGLLQ
ncbi:MAG TPA: anti-sigma factor [Candidatus Acidoferrales bacterium]|nr:anti-sigma factor [Candidatus Acidoferrales bacterium]